MAEMIIQIQGETTGWHPNLYGQGLELRDGWALVPDEAQRALVRQHAGVVDFTVAQAAEETMPDLLDRRTAERGTAWPVTAAMTAGTYTPPPAPPETEPEPTDAQVLNTLLGVTG